MLVPGGCNLLDVAPSVLGPRLGPPGSSGSAAKAGGRHTWPDMPHKVTIVNSARDSRYCLENISKTLDIIYFSCLTFTLPQTKFVFNSISSHPQKICEVLEIMRLKV